MIDAAAPTPPLPPAREAELRGAARALEASFLAEMLNHSGLGRTPEGMGGGAGEDAFASLLVREQADAIAASGGVGLADAIYESLLRAEASR